jgi:hypothetical protein
MKAQGWIDDMIYGQTLAHNEANGYMIVVPRSFYASQGSSHDYRR